jgi:hypothetical protein
MNNKIYEMVWNTISYLLATIGKMVDGSNLKLSLVKKGSSYWLDGTSGTIVSSIWDAFMFLGICLSVVYFILELNRTWVFEAQNMTYKTVLTPIIKLGISLSVLSKGEWLIGWILQLYNSAISTFADAVATQDTMLNLVTTEDEGVKAIKESFSGWGLFFMLMLLLILLLVSVINVVLKVVWWYKCILVKLELLVRIMVTPVAIGDIYQGRNSNMVRWLKGFLALGLYAGCMIVLPILSTSIAMDMFTQDMTSGFLQFVVGEDGIATNAVKIVATAGLDFFGYIRAMAGIMVSPFVALGAVSIAKQLTKEALS